MTSKYKEYLAAKVLSDGEIITYRALSRALKVHCNVAKKMLFDFYSTQNARKPGSLHACYLVAGSQGHTSLSAVHTNGTGAATQIDGMASTGDSFLSSSMPEPEVVEEIDSVKLTAAVLVAEEKLQDVKKQFEAVTSIHVYCIGPGPRLSNIQVISDSNRKIAIEHASEDLMLTWKEYGTIYNPHAKKRTLRAPPPAPVAAPATTSAMKPAASVSKDSEQASAKPAPPSTASNTKTAPKPNAQLKRENSNLFQSFAKAKTQQSQQPKKEEPKKQVKLESDSDEDMDEDLPAMEDSAEMKAKAEANKQARMAREANLRKMMDDPEESDKDDDDNDDNDDNDDELMEDAPNVSKDNDDEVSDAAALDASTAPSESKAVAASSAAATTSNVTVSNGRRRGRRRVMKKVQKVDAEGWMVTTEEPEWESFSEDEKPSASYTAQQKQQQQSSFKKSINSLPSSSGAAGAKKGPSGTQGSIMSFFQKK